MGKKGGGQQQAQTTSNTPWAGVQPYMTDAFSRAQTLANQTAPNAMQSTSYNMTNNLATQGNPMNDAALGLNTDTIAGKYLSPDSNPYLQQTVNKALNDVQTRVNSQFSGNNYGSSANQEMLTRNLADTASNMYAQNYANERNNQQQALSLTPSLNANRYLDANQLSQAGAANAEAPWSSLKNYASILGLGASSGNSTTTGSTSNSSSPLSTIAGLASIGGALFSDARLKTNIKRVGTHPIGIGIYDYDKFGKRERGVMAQEVEQVMPEAVAEHPSGYKMVNYGLLN